jgi:hypothetical protein
MIQYRKSDGTLGEFDNDKLHSIEVNEHSFTATLRYYGWDEYDWSDEKITDIIELRIG